MRRTFDAARWTFRQWNTSMLFTESGRMLAFSTLKAECCRIRTIQTTDGSDLQQSKSSKGINNLQSKQQLTRQKLYIGLACITHGLLYAKRARGCCSWVRALFADYRLPLCLSPDDIQQCVVDLVLVHAANDWNTTAWTGRICISGK